MLQNLKYFDLGRPKISTKTSYVVSKMKPFRKSFICLITENNENIDISIQELGYKVAVPIEQIKRGDKIGVSALCLPINAHPVDPIEDYTNLLEFNIMLN